MSPLFDVGPARRVRGLRVETRGTTEAPDGALAPTSAPARPNVFTEAVFSSPASVAVCKVGYFCLSQSLKPGSRRQHEARTLPSALSKTALIPFL